MLHKNIKVGLLCLLVLKGSLAAQAFQPTTTLAAETGNNTSAPGTLAASSNGNAAPSNISKVPVRSLLGPQFKGKIFAHYMPWWGSRSHINIGMSGHDPDQVRRQVQDMISRGFDGVIVAEWNSNEWNFGSTQVIANAVGQRPGFLFALMENKGALRKGGDPTRKLISDLRGAAASYFSMPNYYRVNGRPVIFFFDADIDGLDWDRAKAGAPENPLFIFRNPKGFRRKASDGAFGWLGSASPGDASGLRYLEIFYDAARGQSEFALGSAWKGVDDGLASWSKGRIVPQRCGRTWLESLQMANQAASKLAGIQVATWNDYEEGTEVETGIENCATLKASISGNVLKFEPQFSSSDGNEQMVDHYTVYISQDGQNLAPMVSMAPGSRKLELAPFRLDPGMYYFYVQMVGRPMIQNRMSEKLPYAVRGK